MPDMLVKLYDLPEDAQTACPRDGAYRSAAQWRRINFVWWNG